MERPSWLERSFAWSARSTETPPPWRCPMSAENGTPSAVEIFHRMLIVGVLWPSSTCPSIARETPETLESRSSDSPCFVRRRRRFAPTTGVRS